MHLSLLDVARGSALMALLPIASVHAQAKAPEDAASAHAAAAQTAPVERDATADARELRRVFHLANGQVVRVASRWSDDHWEYRNKSGWNALAPAQVIDVALESDLLKEWNTRRDRVDLAKLDERVKLAAWAMQQGLVQEGLEQCDVVLARDPDRAGVLELLRRDGLMNTPSPAGSGTDAAQTKDAFYRWAASMPPSGREIAVNALRKQGRNEAMREDLAKELRSPVVTRRAFGALALRRLFRGEALEPLVLHAVLDPSEDVRTLSALALRAANEPGVIVPVVRALESDSQAARTRAAEALGAMGYAAAVEPLVERLQMAVAADASGGGGGGRIPHSYIFVGRQVAYIQDYDVLVAQYQSAAKPKVNVLIEGAVQDSAVIGVQDVSYSVESSTIQRSLQKLTGYTDAKSAKDWQKWWAANGSKWQSSDLSKTADAVNATGAKG
jgi:hypothetical protein